jgi:hypothetical protein
MHVLQPLVRAWARRRPRRAEEPAAGATIDRAGTYREGRVLVVPHIGPRAELVGAIAANIRRAGVRASASTGWDSYDVRLLGSATVSGELLTSAYPEGYVQVRIRRRPRGWGATVVIAGLAFTSAIDPLAVLFFSCAAAAEIGRGVWRTGPVVRRAVREVTG